MLVLAFLLTAWAGHAVAQDTTVAFLGTVIDSASSMPIGEVAVYVDGRNFTDTTNLAGEFFVGDLPTGTHVVLLLRNGYAPHMAQLTVPEGLVGEVDIGVVVLSRGPPPGADLTGTVVDALTGQPLLGVNVGLSGQATP